MGKFFTKMLAIVMALGCVLTLEGIIMGSTAVLSGLLFLAVLSYVTVKLFNMSLKESSKSSIAKSFKIS